MKSDFVLGCNFNVIFVWVVFDFFRWSFLSRGIVFYFFRLVRRALVVVIYIDRNGVEFF